MSELTLTITLFTRRKVINRLATILAYNFKSRLVNSVSCPTFTTSSSVRNQKASSVGPSSESNTEGWEAS